MKSKRDHERRAKISCGSRSFLRVQEARLTSDIAISKAKLAAPYGLNRRFNADRVDHRECQKISGLYRDAC